MRIASSFLDRVLEAVETITTVEPLSLLPMASISFSSEMNLGQNSVLANVFREMTSAMSVSCPQNTPISIANGLSDSVPVISTEL